MSKSVRYKLHKSKKNPRRIIRKDKGRSSGKKKSLNISRIFKIFFFLVLLFLLIYWFCVAYRTVQDIRVQDIIGADNNLVSFGGEGKVKKTLIIYEDFTSVEEKNVFILAVIYNTDTSESLIYYLPRDTYIKDVLFDNYISIENLTYAGDGYMYEQKYAYVVNQIEEQMAIDFDSYIWFGSEVAQNFVSDNERWGYKQEDVESLFSKLSFFNLIPKYYKSDIFYNSLYSDMSFFEIYTYFQNMRGIIVSGNFQYIDLGDKVYSNIEVLPNGTKAKVINFSEFDKSLRTNPDVLRTKALSREHVKVEVYNSTGTPMYAKTIAREIFNAGCNVIRHENVSQPYDRNYIYIPSRDKFVNGLEVVLEVIEDPLIIEGRPDFLTTGDIIVVLGGKE